MESENEKNKLQELTVPQKIQNINKVIQIEIQETRIDMENILG